MTNEEALNHPLYETQVALEDEMRAMGVDNFVRNAEKALEKGKQTRIAPVKRLMDTAHHQFVEALKAFYGEVESKTAGRKHAAYHYLKAIGDDDLIAHLTCRLILDVSAKRQSLSHVSVMIAEALEDECNYRHFKEQHVAGYLKAASRAKNKGNDRIKRRHVLGYAKRLGVNLLEWPKRDMILVGSKLVEMFVEATGLIRLKKEVERLSIEEVPEMREWIEEESRRCALMSPAYLPMVMPPKPWTSPFSGGYWTGRVRRLTLVKSPNRAYLEELSGVDMPEVYTAINALQNTAWNVNLKVLEVMETLWDTRSTSGVIPLADPAPLPQKPVWLEEGMTKEDMTEDQKEEFLRWKSECVHVRDTNAEEESKRRAFVRMLWVANKFKGGEFFYPYQLDWRGRAYPVGLYLQPQGDDPQRGLLTFADLCPIHDQASADWLAIHGAGLWGIDKCSFADRLTWVEGNQEAILASAEDPYNNRFWMSAEKPWQALAFCLDWAGFKKEGFGYLSSLPVQMDGTCNGLQNFSAMLLDERGGSAVNLVPAEKPQDIYSEVAKVVEVRVAKEAGEGHEMALMWLGHVNRKLVKRPVMTLAYGAKKYGYTDMINDDTIRPWKSKKPETYPFGKQGWQAAQYMAGLIWDAVQSVVVKAAEAMQWLQSVAQIVSKEALPINWTTPTGLLVQQAYKLRKMKDIEVTFQKVRIRPKIDEGCDKLDSRKQANGISPNWVHSLDASHMMRTICASKLAGVEAFSFIHDSYGTHAGNTAFLAETLREEFVKMYSGCVLSTFREDLQAMLPEGIELPPVPLKGSLDLEQVRESAFFFA
jgi:DNA-directed RNA polymerase